jgi:uncharacterized tellurite resistance protein B-like protein
MDSLSFKEILLDVAVCSIACDGDFDEREIKELKSIEKNSTYFSGVDLEKMLLSSIEKCKLNYTLYKEEVFEKIIKNDLSVVNQLTILEISLRIIAADGIEKNIEKEFVNELRKNLDVEDFIIKQRFGDIDFLKPKQVDYFKDR